jgi:hypothetical protein
LQFTEIQLSDDFDTFALEKVVKL